METVTHGECRVWELVRGMKKAEGGVWDEFLVSGSDGHVDSGAIS